MIKKVITVILLIAGFATAANSQLPRKPLAAYLADSLWHFIDYSGKDLFPPMELIEVSSYSDGLFRALKKTEHGNKWVFINGKGQIAFQPDCDIAGSFHQGRAIIISFTDKAKENPIYGYIDLSGKEVIDKQYDDAIEFSEGLAYVMKKDKRGYIDTSGTFIFELLEDIIGYSFQNGIARISNENYYFGYIDKTGRKIIDLTFEETGNFCPNLAPANDKNKMGYINKKGEFVLPAIWDDCREFSEGLAFVGANDDINRLMWSVIDTAGMKLTEYEFTNAIDYSEGLAAVEKNSKWAFIDKNGFMPIDYTYDFAGKFKDGLSTAGIRSEKKFGFIDTSGKFVVILPENVKSITDLRFNSKAF